MVSAPKQSIEPTPEFNERCMEIIQTWHHGELPPQETISLLNTMLDEATRDGHPVNQGRAEQLLGYIHHYLGNLNTSIQHNERARALYQQVGNLNRVAVMDLNQGENYRLKGDFNRALRLYRAAYNSSNSIDATRAMAAVNEGLVLLTLGQYDDAFAAFTTSKELIAQLEDEFAEQATRMLCEIHHGMAVIHLKWNDYRQAWTEALKALGTAESNGEPLQYGYANRTLGEVISALGEAPDSRFSSDPDDYFRTALHAFKEINAEAEIAKTMFAQALSLAERGKRTMAARKLQQVMIIFTRLEMVDDAARAAEAQLAVI